MKEEKLAFNKFFKKAREIGPILRRLFINTLFDSTFTLIGIIVGSIFSTNPNLQIIIGTAVASSFALGISSGVSVYESETIERERKQVELERALFLDLKNTVITENYKYYALILAFINFLTPLVCCGLILVPFILTFFDLTNVVVSSWISVSIAFGIIFVSGIFFGRFGKTNPLVKGLRMVFFGAVAFLIGYFIQIII
jgi:predicted membrane protein (TIGR00267 family)